MALLRTLTVLEHELIPVRDRAPALGSNLSAGLEQACLSSEEADELLRINERRKGFCSRVPAGIKLAHYCGIVRLRDCIVEVLPKIRLHERRAPEELHRSRGTLLRMLHVADLRALTTLDAAPQSTVKSPLLDVFIEAFLNCALDQARRGLLFRYEAASDGVRTLRGRFNSHRHARHNLAKPHLLHCDFDEFSPDNPFNQAVTATLQACRSWIIQPRTQRLWFEAQACFAGVSVRRMTHREVAQLARDRTNRHYDPLLRWCEWLLSISSPSMAAGLHDAPGLLFDMNQLFENFVGAQEAENAGHEFIVQRQQPARYLASTAPHEQTNAFLIAPDITIAKRSTSGPEQRIVRIVDAKWKRLNPASTSWGVEVADVYQMLAYATRYQCRRVELVYPMSAQQAEQPGQPPVFHIDVAGTEGIEVAVRQLAC
ncbi:hypothetical protein P0Y43_18745 [Pseudomonas entomophila]|uniref:McrC family protein n=1 Tax=Pseudomonas entomophila TaxID=312306 RepID=UPI0023D7D2F0|nr:hypothetical protein [Pseudomonas entomophila]MDF0732729.1 hypothetical protein [Pseudomonas entomophila]